MTRETKIGLLVGLAFIIVIGILLSDHMTSTTQPPQAALVEAAPNVRESVTTMAPANPGPAPLSSFPVITPSNRVPTQSELRPAPVAVAPPVSQVVVGGPSNNSGSSPISIHQTGGSPVVATPAGPVVATADAPTADNGSSTLEQWGKGAETTTDVRTPVAPAVVAPAPAGRVYVAQVGDSLSRITAKFFGTDSKAGREAIVKANASLIKNPDVVVEGRKYNIPTGPAVVTVAVAPAPAAGPTGIPETVAVGGKKESKTAPKAIPVTQLVDRLPNTSPAPAGGTWYVVKENDNLWKIASDQLGSGNAWQQLRDFNKDVLKGGDTVQPNMRLRIPGKPLASAAE